MRRTARTRDTRAKRFSSFPPAHTARHEERGKTQSTRATKNPVHPRRRSSHFPAPGPQGEPTTVVFPGRDQKTTSSTSCFSPHAYGPIRARANGRGDSSHDRGADPSIADARQAPPSAARQSGLAAPARMPAVNPHGERNATGERRRAARGRDWNVGGHVRRWGRRYVMAMRGPAALTEKNGRAARRAETSEGTWYRGAGGLGFKDGRGWTGFSAMASWGFANGG